MSGEYRHDGDGFVLIATVRYDDRCGNGYDIFSITTSREFRAS